MTCEVLRQFYKILHLIVKEPTWRCPEGLLLPNPPWLASKPERSLNFQIQAFARAPHVWTQKENPQMGCQTLHKGHWFPTSPGSQRGERGLYRERSSTQVQASDCRALRFLPSCYQREKGQNSEQKPDRSLPVPFQVQDITTPYWCDTRQTQADGYKTCPL